jgi:membrane-associated phospholipid phosphatase
MLHRAESRRQPFWPSSKWKTSVRIVDGSVFQLSSQWQKRFKRSAWNTHSAWRRTSQLQIECIFSLIPLVGKSSAFVNMVTGFALAILIGGIGFLLLPSQPAYGPPGDLGAWAWMYRFADQINLTYNMAPSLHVALSVCCVAVFARRASGFVALLLWAWAAAIAASTLLTHQHHLLDAVTGWGLGLAASCVTLPRFGEKWQRPA